MQKHWLFSGMFPIVIVYKVLIRRQWFLIYYCTVLDICMNVCVDLSQQTIHALLL